MPARPEILIVGAGGHARVIVEIVRSTNRFRIKGVLDQHAVKPSETVLGAPIIGTWDDLARLRKKGLRWAALAIGDNAERERAGKMLSQLGFQMPALIHKKALVEPTATVEPGAVICLGAIIGAGAVIRAGALVNTGSIIDHETDVYPYAHIAPGCAIAGRVSIGAGTFIGIGSRVIDHVKIGSWTVIGAGSVVVGDLPDHITAYGVPARIQKGTV